jgi:hypothetical protein
MVRVLLMGAKVSGDAFQPAIVMAGLKFSSKTGPAN